ATRSQSQGSSGRFFALAGLLDDGLEVLGGGGNQVSGERQVDLGVLGTRELRAREREYPHWLLALDARDAVVDKRDVAGAHVRGGVAEHAAGNAARTHVGAAVQNAAHEEDDDELLDHEVSEWNTFEGAIRLYPD